MATLENKASGGRGIAHVPTKESRKMVEALAAYGVTHEEIARAVGIVKHTLYRHYPDELATGLTKANARVAETLFRKATAPDITGPSVSAAIFWLKTRARWRTADSIAAEEQGTLGRYVSKKELAAMEAAAVAGGESEWGDLLKPDGLPN